MLSTGGNEPDVDAMLKIYGVENTEEPTQTDIKTDTKPEQTDTKPEQTDTKPIQNRTKVDEKNTILDILRVDPTATMEALSKKLDIIKSSVQRRLDSLVKEGRLRHIGPSNGGYWEIIES